MTFEFLSVPRIVFGRGEAVKLREIAASFGRCPLVVHNGRGAEALIGGILVRQKGEPTLADVDRAAEMARKEQCDVIVGFGGGSAIDTAKAVAGLVANGGAATDYMEVVGRGMKIAKPGLPWIAVPTTAGTGAEVTKNAVVGWPEKKFKASLRSEYLMARVALVDPLLGVNVPQEVTAASGMDALCQCIESYVSKNANPMTDGLAIEGIRLAALHLKSAWMDGENLDAREAMAQAALISGITLTNAGLGAVHGFAAPLGANYPVPHGVVCAVLLADVMAANLRAAQSSGGARIIKKYADLGRAMTGVCGSDESAAQGGVEFIRRLVSDMAIPRLNRYGLATGGVDAMVQLAKRASSMRFNPVELPEDVLGEILRSAI